MEDISLQAVYVGRFIGPDKITAIEVSDKKTAGGSVIFNVTLNEGDQMRKIVVTEKTLPLVATKELSDYTKLLEAKINTVCPMLVDILLEYDISYAEIGLLERALGAQLEYRFNRALSYLFLGDDSRFIPGWDPKNDVSLVMVQNVISEIPEVVKENGESA